MPERDPKVDAYMTRLTRWEEEIKTFRGLLLDSELQEEFKWGKPCYTYKKKPVAIIYDFKDSTGIGFWKGVLINDPKHRLVSPGENSQAVKMIKFSHADEIKRDVNMLKAFIGEAVQIEKDGRTVEKVDPTQIEYVPELRDKLDSDPALRTAFEKLTPGRRRAYNIFFSGAKQSETRQSRIEKMIPLILQGKGMNDR